MSEISIFQLNIMLNNLTHTLCSTHKLSHLKQLQYSCDNELHHMVTATYVDGSKHLIRISSISDELKIISEVVDYYITFYK